MDNSNVFNVFLVVGMLAILLILMIGVMVCLCKNARISGTEDFETRDSEKEEASQNKSVAKSFGKAFTGGGFNRGGKYSFSGKLNI